MKMRGFAIAIFGALTFVWIASVAAAQSENDFNRATSEYAAGHFQEAIQGYNQLIADGKQSANLFYNLANAYFRTGDFGRAILNYERALALDRHHPESQANLQIARDEAHALELAPSGLRRFVHFGSTNQYAIVTAIAFWLAVFSFAVWLFRKPRRPGAILCCILCLCCGGLTGFLTFSTNDEQRAKAVVIGRDVQARLATADNANTILALPPGSEIHVLSRRGDWIYADLPNNLRGWIPAKDAENVRS